MDITILLFDEVDLLDAGGPYEVFLTASRLVRRDGGNEPFSVRTASLDGQAVKAFGGLGLTPDTTLAAVLERLERDPSSPHVLIVPGTIDIDSALRNRDLLDVIAHHARLADGRLGSDEASPGSATQAKTPPSRVTASVCTGAFLLSEAGLLDGRDWTTHWEDIDLLSERIGPDGAQRDVRWVDNDTIVTAGGLSAGIDMALHLVHRFAGLELATRTAKQIDYRWQPEG